MGLIDPNGGITPLVQVSWAGFCSCCKRPLDADVGKPTSQEEKTGASNFHTFLYIYQNLSCLPLYIFSKILAPLISSRSGSTNFPLPVAKSPQVLLFSPKLKLITGGCFTEAAITRALGKRAVLVVIVLQLHPLAISIRFAYVVCLWGTNSEHVLGAMVLAYSLRRTAEHS